MMPIQNVGNDCSTMVDRGDDPVEQRARPDPGEEPSARPTTTAIAVGGQREVDGRGEPFEHRLHRRAAEPVGVAEVEPDASPR